MIIVFCFVFCLFSHWRQPEWCVVVHHLSCGKFCSVDFSLNFKLACLQQDMFISMMNETLYCLPVVSFVCDTATVSLLTECSIPSFCSAGSDESYEEDSHRHQTHFLFVSPYDAHEKVRSPSRRARLCPLPPWALQLNPPANLQLKWW